MKKSAGTYDGKKIGISIAVAIFIVIVLTLCIRVVDTGEVAVVTRFGAITGSEGEGLHLKSPIDEYHMIRVTQDQVEEIYYTATKDTQSIDQTIVTQVIVDPTRVEDLYRKFKGNHINGIVKPVLYDGFKSATAGFTLEDAIAKRDQLSAKMLENVKDNLARYGINIVSVEIKDVQIPEEYKKAVEDKKVAEQIRAKTEVEKQTAIIRAEQELEVKKLEAEANRVVTESLTEQILQKMYLDKWDGKLPMYLGGNGDGIGLMLPMSQPEAGAVFSPPATEE
jgi:regulator of protease activity HflC (stomatin/prohibitin superfamily)